MEPLEMLIILESVYELLRNGIKKPAYDIQRQTGLPQKYWLRLSEVIERKGNPNKPIYKWIAPPPDLYMATELLREYPILIQEQNKDVLPETETKALNVPKVLNISFETFWIMYDKKEDRVSCERKWKNLTNKERQLCIESLPQYIKSTPIKAYRKNPLTYLNRKSWENEIINYEIKNNNTMLHERDHLFNWVVPEITAGRNITEDLRVNVKHNTLYLGYQFIDVNYPGIDRNNVRVSFQLNDNESKYLVVNPVNGVPFFKFNASLKGNSKHKSPSLSNKALVLKFVKVFQLKKDEIASFKLDPFQRINGMMFFTIVKK